MAVVKGIESFHPVIQRGMGQKEVIDLRSCQPPEALERFKGVAKGVPRWGDQGKHLKVLLDFSEDLSVGDPKPSEDGEEFPHGLLGNTRSNLSALGLFPEGQAELAMVQGRGRGSDEKAGVIEDDFAHSAVGS